jgi:hypothetical protein
MLIRMTGIGTQIVALIGAATVAAGGLLGAGSGSSVETPTALVVDASLARDGRELVDARLRDAADELRVPRTAEEARTDVRYLAASGHRIVALGPQASAATAGTTAERAATVVGAVAAARR